MALADVPDVDLRDVESIPPVLVDPPLLERVIANLAGNAARHTRPGGGSWSPPVRWAAGWS